MHWMYITSTIALVSKAENVLQKFDSIGIFLLLNVHVHKVIFQKFEGQF